MSDAIREAFELHFAAYHGGNNMTFDHGNNYYLCQEVNYYWLAFQAGQEAALQSSQTAPAVPGTAFGLHHVSRMYQVMRKHDSTIDDAALDSMRDTLRHVLTAPRPDHSPDAGKEGSNQ